MSGRDEGDDPGLEPENDPEQSAPPSRNASLPKGKRGPDTGQPRPKPAVPARPKPQPVPEPSEEAEHEEEPEEVGEPEPAPVAKARTQRGVTKSTPPVGKLEPPANVGQVRAKPAASSRVSVPTSEEPDEPAEEEPEAPQPKARGRLAKEAAEEPAAIPRRGSSTGMLIGLAGGVVVLLGVALLAAGEWQASRTRSELADLSATLKAPKPATPGDPELDKRLKELQMAVGGLSTKLGGPQDSAALKKAIEELPGKLPMPTGNPATISQKQIDELKAEIAKLPKPGAAELPKDLNEKLARLDAIGAVVASLDKLEKAVEKLNGTVTELEKSAKTGPGKALDELKASLADARKELAGLPDKVRPSTVGIPFEKGQDIQVVALNSPNLKVDDFMPAYRDFFKRIPRGKDRPVRVGFIAAQTVELNPVLGLEDTKELPGSVGPAAGDATEDPGRFGLDLKRKHFDNRRPNQRVILVASLTCPPLTAQDRGWGDLAGVDVILIQKEATPRDKDGLLDWHRFCQEHHGTLRVIPGPDRQVEKLKEELLRIDLTPPGDKP